jgi:hypothetical protein
MNMAYVQVPKDLTRVKTKVMFNLTKRQLICFGSAGVLGLPAYFFTKGPLGTTFAACLMIIIVLPLFLFGVYEKDGRPLEKILMSVYRQKIKCPGIRPYETRNMYGAIQKNIYETEVLKLYDESEAGAARKGASKSKAAQGKNKSRKRK